jgi:hypothetical protein
VEVAGSRIAGLRDARFGETSAHRDLVGHQVGGFASDARQAKPLRDGRNDGHGAVCRDGEDSVHGVPATGFGHRVDILEIDDLACVSLLEAERLGVAIDGDYAVTELTCPQDGAALVPAGAYEEDRSGLGHVCTGKRNAARSQRAVSQPFVRLKVASTKRPRRRPSTLATWGPA